ncbi:S-(hydroxymethyl)glutathione dehydrogenase / alcohol dehydrogenase [Parafrankia irregularis]|uniref:S-(Hydroxymethyl)glutathione dehydrogenase / alcohol dehydrogenase n=1 Tax=Parafrankia irregularis TaxID=795642 RepID=A0A0S4QMJ4_9ACTN|nr:MULTISPECIES: Zn-dependent alcohol dehydrogenase [Parafrankia]CUU56088.1 S-(hydroxymethyl)glutathione dehydrogenase / alcohol dehydrogenase [Parafrankia irregularis]
MGDLLRGIVWDGSAYHVVDDLEVRPPGPGEVEVRMTAAGLCHSDLAVVRGTIPFPTPVVLGHEGAGVVSALGPGVTGLAEGEAVALTTLGNCGACEHCDAGQPTMCRSTFGRRPQPFTWRGTPTYNFANTSCFAERVVVAANQCVPVPDDVPAASAALLGCGVLTGVGAVLNRAQVRPGSTVAVIGVGGIGLNVIQGAALAGATRVVAVDTNPAKAELAYRFGATDFVDPSGRDTAGAVRDLLPADSTGVDYSFECVGHPALARAAVDMLGWHGTAVLLGVPAEAAELSVPITDLYLDKSVMGCRYGSSRPQRDVRTYLGLYRGGRLLLDELVTRTYPLDAVGQAMHDLETGDLARGVLTFTR